MARTGWKALYAKGITNLLNEFFYLRNVPDSAGKVFGSVTLANSTTLQTAHKFWLAIVLC
jgi:hypothetical protein